MKKTLFAFCVSLVGASAFAQPVHGQQLRLDHPDLPRARAECARTVGVEDLRDYQRCMTRMGFGHEIRAERGQQMREERREDRRDARQGFNPGAGMEHGQPFDHVGQASRMEQQRQEEARPALGWHTPEHGQGATTRPTPRGRIGATECKAMTGGSPGIPSFDACMNANAAVPAAPPAVSAPGTAVRPQRAEGRS